MAKGLLWPSERCNLIYYILLLSKRRYKGGGERKDKHERNSVSKCASLSFHLLLE